MDSTKYHDFGNSKRIFVIKSDVVFCLFLVYFRLFKQTLQFLQQIYVKNVLTIQYTAPRPLEYESPPLTTRQGLPPKLDVFYLYLCLIIVVAFL